MKIQVLRISSLLLGCLMLAPAMSATDWSAQDYDLYPGDFNGDKKTDVLYVAKSPSMPSGIALSDGTQWVIGFQGWNSNEFGIPWHSNIYKPIIGDFNNDGRDDVFMQRQTVGNCYILFANGNPNYGPIGKLTGISVDIPTGFAGVHWTADYHQVIVGNFDGQPGADVFLQGNTSSEIHRIYHGSASGITSSYTDVSDSAGGFTLNAASAVLHAGNFNGDAYDDLLIQAKGRIVMIDYDIPIPVLVFKPQSYGIIYIPIGSGYQIWNRQQGGIDWSPGKANIVIGDFDGDGRDDVIVQAKNASGATSVVKASSVGQLQVDAPTSLSFSGLGAGSADGYRILAADFAGHSTPVHGAYLQSVATTGNNYVSQSIPTVAGVASVVTQLSNPAEVISYSYDAKGRLIRVGRVGIVNNNVTTTYTYDKANNRTNTTTSGSQNSAPQ